MGMFAIDVSLLRLLSPILFLQLATQHDETVTPLQLLFSSSSSSPLELFSCKGNDNSRRYAAAIRFARRCHQRTHALEGL